MRDALIILAVPMVFGLLLWLSWLDRAYSIELAARPEEQYNVAGLDKAAEVGYHAWWGNGPWRMRRIRRQLDAAAEKIARFEQEQRDRKRRSQQ